MDPVMRKHFIVTILLLLCRTVVGSPNILLLVTDQTRPDALSSGGGIAETPNLDRLASEGVTFTHAYSSTPICTPARASLITGRSPWRHGMRGYLSSIAPSSSNSWIELPQTLRDAGYYVGIAGKNHFGFNSTSSTFFDHGFQSLRLYEGLLENDPYDSSFQLIDTYDSFFNDSCPLCDPLATVTPGTWNSWLGAPYVYEEGLHPTSWTASAGINFLSEWIESDSLSSMPFFLKLSFHRPHSPYDPPERWFDAMMAKSDQIQGPANGTTDSASAWDSVYTFSSNCNASHDECGGGCGTEAYCGGVNRSDFLYTRSLYHGSLSFVDEQFGRVLDWLETTKLSGAASSLLDNTFILYTSDHGDALGDHSLWRKGYPFQQVASVPLFIRWPSSMTVALSRGSAVESVVEIRDVFPTLADVANVDISDWGTGTSAFDNPDGESLIPLLAQPDSQTFWREYIGLEMAECASQLSAGTGMNWNALTDGHMKYIYFFQKGDEMLFDLDVDPYELSNLVADPNYSEALSLWRSRLVTQFEDEGRGDVWILNGELQKISSCSSVKLLPSYPCYPDQCSMA